MADVIAQTLAAATQAATAAFNENSIGIGPIAQTAPSVTQAATGLTLYRELYESAEASGLIYQSVENTLTSSADASSSLSVVMTDSYGYSADGSDTLTYEVITSYTDTATASNHLRGSIYDLHLSSGRTYARDRLTPTYQKALISTAQAFESFTFERSYSLSDSATASETIDPGVTYNQAVSASADASNSFVTGQSEALSSSADGSNLIVIDRAALELQSHSATANESFSFWALSADSLSSSADTSNRFTFEGATINYSFRNTADATDRLWAKDFDAIAWVMNTENGALTNYDNFGFTSMAFHNGVVYATSKEGVFALDADKDEARAIAAVSKGGFLDFGTERTKRVSDIFVGYTGGDLECSVETYDGPEEVYTYPMEYRDADAPRNNRLKVGKGLSSRYWRLTFNNVNGADFQIYDVAVNVAASNRRL